MAKTSKYRNKREKTNNPEAIKPEPLNKKQDNYIKFLETCPVVVAIGPPGTSKSFIPSSLGAYWLHHKLVDKVVIARSPVGPGKEIGYLPGTAEEKLEGWMTPVVEAMKYSIGAAKFDYCLKSGQIEFCNLTQIKGRTFDQTLVIIDEAEDLDQSTMKAILTRIGENTTFAFNGDLRQQNIRGKSGLSLVLELSDVVDFDIPIIEFDIEDIVRSGTCKSIVKGLIELGHY